VLVVRSPVGEVPFGHPFCARICSTVLQFIISHVLLLALVHVCLLYALLVRSPLGHLVCCALICLTVLQFIMLLRARIAKEIIPCMCARVSPLLALCCCEKWNRHLCYNIPFSCACMHMCAGEYTVDEALEDMMAAAKAKGRMVRGNQDYWCSRTLTRACNTHNT
jgi:hypothetical protein